MNKKLTEFEERTVLSLEVCQTGAARECAALGADN